MKFNSPGGIWSHAWTPHELEYRPGPISRAWGTCGRALNIPYIKRTICPPHIPRHITFTLVFRSYLSHCKCVNSYYLLIHGSMSVVFHSQLKWRRKHIIWVGRFSLPVFVIENNVPWDSELSVPGKSFEVKSIGHSAVSWKSVLVLMSYSNNQNAVGTNGACRSNQSALWNR